jgi:DNA polymerase II large subunit
VRKRGRPEYKSEIARRVQALLPFACPNLRLLSERELRCFERYLTANREPDCQVIGGEEVIPCSHAD